MASTHTVCRAVCIFLQNPVWFTISGLALRKARYTLWENSEEY